MDRVLIFIEGNLVDAPEVRFTPSGKQVNKLRVASSRRYFDRTSEEWVDDDTVFLDVTLWGGNEQVGELERGKKVLVIGRLSQRAYENRDGEKRVAYEVIADSVAAVAL